MSDKSSSPNSLSYRDAGVDIDAGDALVRDIGPDAARTRRAGADVALGGFGGLFDLKAAGFTDPILVAATDGVGTKLELARAVGQHRGLGIDLVAMCVNDLIAQGAIPLFFLDYFATGKLDRSIASEVVAGIADGCVACEAALIGGETAEMPGVYPDGGFDLAGFAVGAAERGTLLSREMPQDGDIAIALPSSGVHANGFSLVRKIIEVTGTSLDARVAGVDAPLGEALMAPTRIYHHAARAAQAGGGLTGICHVTGGGLVENPPRVYGDEIALELDCSSWSLPPLFEWLAKAGNIAPLDLARTFNCGIGMLVFVAADKADSCLAALRDGPEPDAWIAGRLGPRGDGPAVSFAGQDSWPTGN
ncbi:MAG: phosphoribosylformylglycinamidine cyclo-ligase [Pseudomonadota bacterium]|nr:phosphoribosylformylglycinamidine cyclo-ligase [Pseudomonadota bacterium]